MERRNFLRSSGIFAAGIYAGNAKAIAGPFQPGELLHNIPTDKRLDIHLKGTKADLNTIAQQLLGVGIDALML